MSKVDMPQSLVVKSSVEQALQNSGERKESRLFYGVQPEKGKVAGRVVGNTVNNLLLSLTQPKCTYDDLDEIKRRTVDYLQRCAEAQCIPLIEDWAIALGLCRTTLYNWFNKGSNREVAEFLEQVRTSIYAANAQAAYQNAINCVAWIFYGKNSLGMTDKTEIAVSAEPVSPLGDEVPSEELRQKYLSAVVTDE